MPGYNPYPLLIRFLVVTAALLCILFHAPCSLAASPLEVSVEGIEGPPLDNVKEALAIPPGLVSEGRVNTTWLERFAEGAEEKALTALEPFGYYKATVKVTVDASKEGEYRLRVAVTPGDPVLVRAVQIGVQGPGADEKPLREIISEFPLKRDDPLLHQQYEEAKGAMLAKAQALGYLDAEYLRHEISIDAAKRVADIELLLETGRRYRFDGTVIEGAPDYPERFLRRHLTYKKGDVFSYDRLGETQLNFTNSERFREVVVTPDKDNAIEDEVPIRIQLKQVPRRSIRPGAGYGTDTGGRFSLRYRDLNLFRRGHEFSANLYLAERLQGLALNYGIPSYRSLLSSISVQLNLQREDVTTYLSRLAALELNYNRRFGKGRIGTAFVRLQQDEFTIGEQESSSRLVLPGLRYTEDRYDNLIRPIRGYRYSLEARGTHQFMGSDTGLLQFLAEGGVLIPLPWRMGLQVRGKAGITAVKDKLSELPPTLRFFAGGDQSVRGYSYQSLGPRDENGDVIGGNHLLFGSVELERAFFKDWGFSVFFDAGNAFDTFTDMRLAGGAGAGLHYYTPVGALNLYLARQIFVSQPSFHIHFTVGFNL